MKLLSILCFTSFTLASAQYYILRRGIPSRTIRPGFTTKPGSRVVANAEYPKKPRAKPEADVSAKGPASVYYIDADGKEGKRQVPEGEISLRKSNHPRRPMAGGALKGQPSKDEPLKVSSKGKFASVSIIAPPGGSGTIRIEGDGGVEESKVKGGEMSAGAASSVSGKGSARGSVSRPGEAHAIGFDSAADVRFLTKEQQERDRRPEKR